MAAQGKPDSDHVTPLTQRAIATLIGTSDAVVRTMDSHLKAYGLTATQYQVLRALRGAGSRGASCSAIGQHLIKAEPDVTRLLDRLEKRGWIRRERDLRDRRTVKSWITIDGLKLMRDLDPVVSDLNSMPFRLMSVNDVRQFVDTLNQVRDALRS